MTFTLLSRLFVWALQKKFFHYLNIKLLKIKNRSLMGSLEGNEWKTIPFPREELQLEPTLSGGQSFRWKKSADGTWTGVFKKRVWLLRQTADNLLYQCYNMRDSSLSQLNERSEQKVRKRKSNVIDEQEDDETLLTNYFRLDVDLKKYYKLWSQSDPHFRDSATTFYGIRILHQDVIENVFSFICSSNNNIARISLMVEKLSKLYGSGITQLDSVSYYSFPDVERLCLPSVESELRKAGFGYRAKFITQSANIILSLGGEKWLENLKQVPYLEAKKELMRLPGVGAKVADCICLMSLGHLEAIPVDTHIFQVASQIYLPHLKGYKSVTEKIYNEISAHFQNLYQEKAGWAHTILFCSQLKSLKGESRGKKKKDNK